MFYIGNIPSETETFKELSWCPECGSPPENDRAHVQYCQQHMPYGTGAVDHVVDQSSYLVNTEAGGEANKGICDFLHRKEIPHDGHSQKVLR